MPGLVPGIHVFGAAKRDVDARDKRGHDDREVWTSAGKRFSPQHLRPGKNVA